MIRHLLLDADGVVQTIPGGWEGPARRILGDRSPQILEELLVEELPALRGEGDFLPELRRAFERHGIDGDPDELYAELWNRIEVSDEVVALVQRLRAAGYGVHLGTNQHRERATYMRDVLGYEDLFDVGCYSCDLGAAKPDLEFFRRAVSLIGVAPADVLFLDDNLRNVEAARAVGLVAEHWDLTQGMPALLALLAAHELDLR
jgi:putative hydrolase of the HAD superfamily